MNKVLKRQMSIRTRPVKRSDEARQIWVERVMLWIVAASAALIPLIVYLKSIDLRGIMLTSWRGGTEHVDFFNWWKAAALITVMVILVGLHLYRWGTIRNTLEMPRRFLSLLVFMMLAVLSAISSNVSQVALSGFTDRYEGLWVLLCYVMLAYTAFVVSKTNSAIRFILTAVLGSTVIVAVIGILQFVGWDYFQTEFGKRLMLPAIYEPYMDQLSFNFGKNIMYTTVYNPNYLGSYAALLMPVAFGWTFAQLERARGWNGWKRLSWIPGIVVSFGLFSLWLGSMSRAGLLGGGAALALFAVLQIRKLIRRPVQVVMLVAMLVGSFLLLNSASGGLVVEEFRQTLPSRVQQSLGMVPVSEEAVAAVAPESVHATGGATDGTTGSGESAGGEAVAENAGTDPVSASIPLVKEVRLKDNRFRIETETEALEMVATAKDGEMSLRFYDSNGSELQLQETQEVLFVSQSEPVMGFLNTRYASYRFGRVSDYQILRWNVHDFYFTVEEGVLTYVPKPHTYLTEAGVAPFIGFEGHERFATNRGWIWSRTLPLLGKTLFMGYGPDTFALFFPKDDIAWRINLYGAPNIVVDKPHNWYLQTAVNTGVISMLMLLWLLGGFVLDALRARFNRPVKGMGSLFGHPVGPLSGEVEPMSAVPAGRAGSEPAAAPKYALSVVREWWLTGILCGVVGYAIAGVFNDSVVSVAPIFWVVLGVGLGLLRNAERAPEKVEKMNKPDHADKTGSKG